MDNPPDVAPAQGHPGIKGAAHGIKGGRPMLHLSPEERTERRRKQKEAYRRKKGIPPKEVLTWEERKERSDRLHQKRWNEEYRSVWGRRCRLVGLQPATLPRGGTDAELFHTY